MKHYIKESDLRRIRQSMMKINRDEKVKNEERIDLMTPFGRQTETTWKKEKDPRCL